MDIILKPEIWYEINLEYGKKFKAFHKDGELIFPDGSSKFAGDIIPFAKSMIPCEAPGDTIPILDFFPDKDESDCDES